MPKKTTADDIELDLGCYELRRGGRRVRLERKPMELLILLANRRGQLVDRHEIEINLWGAHAAIDTERSINNAVRKIRTALGDVSREPRILETVFGKGYRFVGRIRIVPARADTAHATPPLPQATSGSSSFQQSSLAVLPFSFLGSTEDHRGLSLGFADALIAALGNLEGFFVLPTAAVMKYAGDTDPAKIAERFAVRFVLQGTIQIQERQCRVCVQIFDAQRHSVAFAQTYDTDREQVLELQDEIAARVADALNRRFREMSARSRPRYSKIGPAYSEFMQGYGGSSADDPRLLDESEQHLSRAVARDPEFALAHAMLSYVCANKHFEFDPRRDCLEKAAFHAQRALELGSVPSSGVIRRHLP
jgi:TolB-like protein